MNVHVAIFLQAEDGIRAYKVTGVQTCALPISGKHAGPLARSCRPAAIAVRSRAAKGNGWHAARPCPSVERNPLGIPCGDRKSVVEGEAVGPGKVRRT